MNVKEGNYFSAIIKTTKRSLCDMMVRNAIFKSFPLSKYVTRIRLNIVCYYLKLDAITSPIFERQSNMSGMPRMA